MCREEGGEVGEEEENHCGVAESRGRRSRGSDSSKPMMAAVVTMPMTTGLVMALSIVPVTAMAMGIRRSLG
jgi:hypothetical protein